MHAKCSISLFINRIQIIPTVSYHCIPTRMAVIKKTVVSVGKNVQKLDLHSVLVGM